MTRFNVPKIIFIAAGTGAFIAIAVFYWTNPLVTTAVLSSTLRQSTPLVLGALCGLLCERSGIMNIGIEGQMLLAAFIGFLVNVWTGNLVLSLFSGLAAGAVMGFILAFMSVTLKTNQIISGIVINTIAFGITGYFYSPGLFTHGKLQSIAWPFLKDIPLIGPVFFNTPPITVFTLFLVAGCHYLLFHTPWGLRTRAVGEHPRAADTMGVNVYLIMYLNVIIAGVIAGLAGVFLSLEAVGSFERGMTNGRGFIALAVMIFGRWTPLGSWGAALLFGLATAIQTQLQFSKTVAIPHQFTGMLPYLITIVILALFAKQTRPPASLGIPYEKE